MNLLSLLALFARHAHRYVKPHRFAISSCERSRSACRWVTDVITSSSASAEPLQRLEAMGDLVGIADELRCGAVLDERALLGGKRRGGVGIRVRHRAVACADGVHPLPVARGQLPAVAVSSATTMSAETTTYGSGSVSDGRNSSR